MKSFDINFMIGWAIAAGVAGTFVAIVIGAAFMGAESRQSMAFWMSLWWVWIPVGLLIGFLVGRKSKTP